MGQKEEREVDEMEMKAVPLIYHSLALGNRLNDG